MKYTCDLSPTYKNYLLNQEPDNPIDIYLFLEPTLSGGNIFWAFYVLMIMLLPEEAQKFRTDSPHQNEMVVGRDQIVQWKKYLGLIAKIQVPIPALHSLNKWPWLNKWLKWPHGKHTAANTAASNIDWVLDPKAIMPSPSGHTDIQIPKAIPKEKKKLVCWPLMLVVSITEGGSCPSSQALRSKGRPGISTSLSIAF